MNDIPTDQTKYQKMVQRWQLRMMRSASWSDYQRQGWVRFYKRYRQIQDAVFDPDEPNITLSYVFGLVEQIASKVTEPILRMQPPCDPQPKRFGDMRSAENFKAIARDWYGNPHTQEPRCRSKKEMVICGPRWEIDEWQNVRRRGKQWGMVQKAVEVQQNDRNGKPLFDKDGKPVMAKAITQVPAEIPVDITLHYGFHTRYPSVFNVYPEPDRSTIGTGLPTDVSWLVEDLGELAIEEMAKEVYYDPHDGLTKPLYDFTSLLHDAGQRAEERYQKIMLGAEGVEDNYGPLIVPIKPWSYDSDYGRLDKDTIYPSEGTVDRQSNEDRDKIWVCRGMMANELVTIANGKYIIQRIRDPWHVPLIPARIENLVMDPEFIYGFGAIQPIEDELDELNDIHNLSMSQFIRIVNKLMVIAEGRIVTMNDFKPRAGGKVRVTGDGDVRAAAAEIPQESATSEMLALESNTRGLIEFSAANLDGASGTRGTKQDHKTARGLDMIAANLMSPRYATIQRQGVINEALRMKSMQRFFNQYCWEKIDIRLVKDDGSNAFASFNKDDIYTGGREFDYAILTDPNFGDTDSQRKLAIAVFQEGVDYEKLRAEMKDPTMKKLDLSYLYERVLQNVGYRDTSSIFTMEGKIMSPDEELQILSQGGVVECKGDLLHHIETHILQRGSPALAKAVQEGKADPNTIKNLELLIQQDMAKASAFLKDPVGQTEAKKMMAMRPA